MYLLTENNAASMLPSAWLIARAAVARTRAGLSESSSSKS